MTTSTSPSHPDLPAMRPDTDSQTSTPATGSTPPAGTGAETQSQWLSSLDYRARQRARYVATLLTVLFIGGLGGFGATSVAEATAERWEPADEERERVESALRARSAAPGVTYALDRRDDTAATAADDRAGVVDWHAGAMLDG